MIIKRVSCGMYLDLRDRQDLINGMWLCDLNVLRNVTRATSFFSADALTDDGIDGQLQKLFK